MSDVRKFAIDQAVVAQWLSSCAYDPEEPGSSPPSGGNFEPRPW